MRLFEIFEIFEKIDMSTINAYIALILNKNSDRIISIQQANDDYEACHQICNVLEQIFSDLSMNFSIAYSDVPDTYVATGETDEYGNIHIFVDSKSMTAGFPNLEENPKQWFQSLRMTITHEMMHLDQLNRSGFTIKGKNTADYENPHEIQAHAKDAIDIMHQYNGVETKEDVLSWISKMIKTADFVEINPIYCYWDSFGQHKDDRKSQQVWKRFMSYLYHYASVE